jgi:hypothetical protein
MDSYSLKFSSAVAQSGPLTWGQSEIRALIEATPPEDRHVFNIQNIIPISSETSMQSVLDALRVAIERHASLRTIFVDSGDSALTQRTPASGEVRVDVLQLSDIPGWDGLPAGHYPPREAVSALCARTCGRTSSTYYADPVHITVMARADRPVYLVLCLSHLASDGWGVMTLRRDVTDILYEGSRRLDVEVVQPLDMVAAERSDAGELATRKAVDHWRHCLDAVATADVRRPVNKRAGREFPRICIESAALQCALPHAAHRNRVSTTTVLDTAIAYAAAAATGQAVFLFDMPTCNRLSRRLQGSVGNYSQQAFATWKVTGLDFGHTAREIFASNLTALRYGRYDPLSMKDTFASWPGFDDLTYCDNMINDLRTNGLSSGAPRPWDPAEALAATKIVEGPSAPESGRFWFWVMESKTSLLLTFGSQLEFMSSKDMEQLLRHVEGLCVAQALGQPYHLDGFGSIT